MTAGRRVLQGQRDAVGTSRATSRRPQPRAEAGKVQSRSGGGRGPPGLEPPLPSLEISPQPSGEIPDWAGLPSGEGMPLPHPSLIRPQEAPVAHS